MKSKSRFLQLKKHFKEEYTPFFKQMVEVSLITRGESEETYNYIIEQLLSQFNDVVPEKVNQFKQIEL